MSHVYEKQYKSKYYNVQRSHFAYEMIFFAMYLVNPLTVGLCLSHSPSTTFVPCSAIAFKTSGSLKGCGSLSYTKTPVLYIVTEYTNPLYAKLTTRNISFCTLLEKKSHGSSGIIYNNLVVMWPSDGRVIDFSAPEP